MLTPNNTLELKKAARFRDFQLGRIPLPWLLSRCRLKILIVTDGSGGFVTGSFSKSYFGLSSMLDALRVHPNFFVTFDITKAHRQSDPFKPDPIADPVLHERYGPDYEGFRFTQTGFDISEYDQVWLIGVRSGTGDGQDLQPPELEVLAQFMEDGGGVFGVGDHSTFGESLCSTVPRVKSMRRWTDLQDVPPGTGLERHDTLLKGHNAVYTFDDESDDIPMNITPKYYPLNSFSQFLSRSMPHPVLCGRDGVIDILPDHPHEGEVLDSHQIDLTATFSAGSITNAAEFPNAAASGPKPEVIAWAHIQSDHTEFDFKRLVNPGSFGAIGTYDGHPEDVGRVLVDSTWHHWMDVNLTGRPESELDSPPYDDTNPKTKGFMASTSGQAALARIHNYFQNVALWLASESMQRCMFMKATWGVIVRYPLAVELDHKLSVFQFGELARDAIGRKASQCTRTRWIFDRFLNEYEHFSANFKRHCLLCPPIEAMESFILGGITKELWEYSLKINSKSKKVSDVEIDKLFQKGVAVGFEAMEKEVKRSMKNMKVFEKSLGDSVEKAKKYKSFTKAR